MGPGRRGHVRPRGARAHVHGAREAARRRVHSLRPCPSTSRRCTPPWTRSKTICARPMPGSRSRRLSTACGIRLEHRLREEAARGPRFTPTKFEEQFEDDWVVPGVVLTGNVRPHRPLAGRRVRVRRRLQAQRQGARQAGRGLSADPALRAHGRREAGRPAGWRRLPGREQEGRRRARPRRRVARTPRSGRSWLEPVEDWQERLDAAVALAAETVAKMRAGELDAAAGQGVSRLLPAQARMALRNLSAEKRTILDSPQSGVVSAGAGSGKTTLLARAVYEDVVDRGIPVDEILVVAFNNAAAAHLVARIQDEFAAGREPSEPAIDLSCAWVGTFHALCGRIVRERAHAAGDCPRLRGAGRAREPDAARAGARRGGREMPAPRRGARCWPRSPTRAPPPARC